MTSKERVRIALLHQEPDRTPVNATYTPEIAALLRQKFGEHDDIGVTMGNDMVIVSSGRGFETSYYRQGDSYVCDYGIGWKRVTFGKGSYTEMVERPLSGDKSKLASWNPPDPFEPTQYDTLKRKMDVYGKTMWMVASITCTLFETAWALRGMEELLIDMVEDEDYAHTLFDKVMFQPLHAGLTGVKLGADMLWMGDDIAVQMGMLMSPDTFRKYLKPRFTYMIAEYRKVNPDIKIAYHTCGNPFLVLDDIIEMGVDIYHSIQPKAIDPLEVKRRYGDRLSLWGGLDIQHILPFGTPEEIKAETGRLIQGCAGGGGYIVAPAHHIQPDTPLENILAFYDAAKEYGSYH
ncbi:MAG: uroporphyrinogen decarboxylase family protein [Treponema sp.]|nr:uroporphyrinogen decarboxylase family protein [Treponema sp.]